MTQLVLLLKHSGNGYDKVKMLQKLLAVGGGGGKHFARLLLVNKSE